MTPDAHQFDLSAYARRIGLSDGLEPTLKTLTAIATHHVRRIPFENIDVFVGRRIDISPKALERKLVFGNRGGYCFEQNGLMLGVLRQIGFEVRTLSARVRLGAANRQVIPPRTHLLLVVTVDGVEWLFDVGVGGFSLTGPIRFTSREPQETPHEARLLEEENGKFYHQVWNGKEWVDLYEYTGDPMPFADRHVGNWWTSSNKESKFRHNLFVARSAENGERYNLLNDTVTHRRGSEILSLEKIASADRLLTILRETFDLNLGQRLEARLARRWQA